MVSRIYDLSVFDKPVHVLPLGYIADSDGTPVQTVGDYVGGARRGFILKPSYRDFLNSIHADDVERNVPLPEQRLLVDMANNRLVALLPEDDGLGELDVVPVMRKDLVVEEDLGDDGYRIRVDPKSTVKVSDLGFRFIIDIDGHRTLAEIAKRVRKTLLDDDDDRRWVADAERVTGRTLDQLLADAALELVSSLRTAGAATLEPSE